MPRAAGFVYNKAFQRQLIQAEEVEGWHRPAGTVRATAKGPQVLVGLWAHTSRGRSLVFVVLLLNEDREPFEPCTQVLRLRGRAGNEVCKQ